MKLSNADIKETELLAGILRTGRDNENRLPYVGVFYRQQKSEDEKDNASQF